MPYEAGDIVILINPATYERSHYTLGTLPDTVYSLGEMIIVEEDVPLREGHIASIVNGRVSIPDKTSYDGIDNDLDGLVDENEALHLTSRVIKEQDPLKYINYFTGEGLTDLLIDEKRDNNFNDRDADGNELGMRADEDGDWASDSDDLGQDV